MTKPMVMYKVRNKKTGLFFIKKGLYQRQNPWGEVGSTWKSLGHVKLSLKEGTMRKLRRSEIEVVAVKFVVTQVIDPTGF